MCHLFTKFATTKPDLRLITAPNANKLCLWLSNGICGAFADL